MSCNCNNNVKKIDLNQCGLSAEYFKVNNYFSELVHDWEKQAAKFNLGILELESIEYKEESSGNGQILNKVIFRYKKGHEIVTREFICAPKGDKGDKGDTGDRGLSAYDIARLRGFEGTEADWLISLHGNAPKITNILVFYDRERLPDAEITGDVNGYNITFHLTKPEYDYETTSEVISKVVDSLKTYYYTKSEVDLLVNSLELRIKELETTLSGIQLTYG